MSQDNSTFIENLENAKTRIDDWPDWKKETLQTSTAVYDISPQLEEEIAKLYSLSCAYH